MKRLLFAVPLVLVLALVGSVVPAARAQQPMAPHQAGEVLIKFRDGTSAADLDRARALVGASRLENIRTRLDGLAELELARFPQNLDINAVIARLQADAAVEYAEPNWVYTRSQAGPNDPFYTDGRLWGMYGAGSSPANQFGSNAAAAWAAGRTGSRSVVIGVIDEGIQVQHPDLNANMWVNPFDPVNGVDDDGNGYIDDINGWDFVNNNNSVYDGGRRGSQDSHGTHVAGTIGGVGNNGTGVVGVNWQVTMISGKFLGRTGGTTANAIRAIDYFTDLKTRHNLNIVATSNSWGGGGFSQSLLDAINRGGNVGILFIAAAGNSSANNDNGDFFPADYVCTANGSYDCVISVAAIDRNGNLASFSNFGATTVDIGAPGVDTNSTVPPSTYASYNGTSMATPHVSGAAALYAATRFSGTTGVAQAAQIRNALLSSAVPTASLSGRTVTGGRLDVNAALGR
ncbi:MAG: S8 family serine peptidase [Chloroflexaceae bacterium]|jgi:subtilisin family serine protease|nr:S8 family serine peptidase [Chloroflexaceae bacterium]